MYSVVYKFFIHIIHLYTCPLLTYKSATLSRKTRPISTQVIDLFKQLKPITGHYPYIFIGRNNRSKPICKESVTQVIELLGYKGRASGHGFRHTMSTILHEQGFDSAWIEMQLAHVDKNSIRGTYNYAQYFEKRREMIQWYADFLLREAVIN